MFQLSRRQLKELALEYTLQILLPPPDPVDRPLSDWRDHVGQLLDVDLRMVRCYRQTTRQVLPVINRTSVDQSSEIYGRIVGPETQRTMPPLTCQFWLLEIVDDWDPPRVPPRLSTPAMPGFWRPGSPREFAAKYAAELNEKPR